MPKRKTKLQRRIDRLVREKRELLSKIERLLRERDDEPGDQAMRIEEKEGLDGKK